MAPSGVSVDFNTLFSTDNVLFRSEVYRLEFGMLSKLGSEVTCFRAINFTRRGSQNFWPNFANRTHFLAYNKVWWQSTEGPSRICVDKRKKEKKRRQQNIIPFTHLPVGGGIIIKVTIRPHFTRTVSKVDGQSREIRGLSRRWIVPNSEPCPDFVPLWM